MGFRNATLRTKVVALLTTLIALWSFAAWVTVRDGFNLFGVQTLDKGLSEPLEPLTGDLQAERRLASIYLASPTEQARAAMVAQRQKSEAGAKLFNASANTWRVRLASDADLELRVDRLIATLDGLAATRAAIDAETIDRPTAAAAFTNTIDTVSRVFDVMGQLDDPQIASDVAAIILLNDVREVIAREDALISGVLAAGKINPAEHAMFAQLVGAQRFTLDQAAAALPARDRARVEQHRQTAPSVALRVLEDRIIGGRSTGRLHIEADAWRVAVEPTTVDLERIVLMGGDEVTARATPVAVWIVVRLLVAVGLGLLAVIISVTTARSLVRQLDRMRHAALRLANDRLPDVVTRLGQGETVDVRSEVPCLEIGSGEIGQVAQAFNAAQETAIRTAVEQAELRRGIRDIFLSLARRTQALLHRQLTLLDAMERREDDPEKLEDLFRVDHLTTRMRRNAENLIVLSGASPGRAWRRNVPVMDVVRGAVAEVEDYSRVTVLPTGSVELTGRAVGDVIHLLAELIENALSFSPPHTEVQVSGQKVANGYVIEIEDRGLGMIDEDRNAANERITHPTEFTPSRTAQLGLFVVSRLTERHHVRVQLKESPYGGITAVVLIPQNLVFDPDAEPGSADPGGGQPADRLPERSRSSRRPAELPAAGTASAVPAAGPVALAEPPAGPVRDNSTSPASGEQAAGPSASSRTVSGLPVRVRQANLAAGLRDGQRTPEPPGETEESGVRCPDKIRQTMSSYQAGTRRARSEVVQAHATEDDPATAHDGGNQPPSQDLT